ncbi:fibrous sheath-interacting protein 1 [Pelodytes ibericus]
MDIVKGKLDVISRPPSISKPRPGSRISGSFSEERPRINSAVGSFEVLTPEPRMSQVNTEQWEVETQSDDGQWTPVETIFVSNDESEFCVSSSNESNDQSQNSTGRQNEENTDPKLENAMKKMKALDKILLKKMVKEKEVKVQGQDMRKRLWQELQCITTQTSARSNEENMNTNKFLALTPQMDEAEDTTKTDEVFVSVFPTQLPGEDFDSNDSGALTNEMLNNKRSNHGTKQKKNRIHKKGVDFIRRNIELVKDDGFLLMDDEKLRLEHLLADIDCNEEEITGDMSLWIIPGEGYTPEPNESDQLAKIEAELQLVQCDEERWITSDHEFPTTKSINVEPAPGERILHDIKMFREQQLRLKEIDQQIEYLENSHVQLLSDKVTSPYNRENRIKLIMRLRSRFRGTTNQKLATRTQEFQSKDSPSNMDCGYDRSEDQTKMA